MRNNTQKALNQLLEKINNDEDNTIVIEDDESTDDVRSKRNGKYVVLRKRKQSFIENRRRFVENIR